MPVPAPDALPGAARPLPAAVDVVVIGGGIIGATSALFLSQKGLKVALCEKGIIAGEQSGRNWGWVRVMGRDPAEIPLALESRRIWRELDAIIGGETGYRATGILYLADTEADLAMHEEWLGHARNYQLDSRLIGKGELAEKLPGAARPFAGALFTPSDGRAEPQKAAPAIAKALLARGVAVLTGTAVRGVERKGGRLCGVVTERGTIACQAALLAGGAWSRLFLGNLGVDFPQLKVLGSVAATKPFDGPVHAAGASDFAFRKRLDGGYTLARRNASEAEITPDSFRLLPDFAGSFVRNWRELRLRIGGRFVEEFRMKKRWRLDETTPFEAVRVLDPQPNPALIEAARANLVAAFPAFAGIEIVHRWGGLVDVTPDAVPAIGPVSSIPGLYVASGFSGHGFGIGPGAGRLAAEIVTGSAHVVDAQPYRLERFKRTRKSLATAS
jgi:glycine/D-amino acid oxidase-like deaminating enzyme